MWHEDLPATNRSFYLIYFSAYLHTFCSCLYTTLGIAAIRYVILRGWCGSSATPSWLYGVALVSSVSINSIWSRFLGFWVSKTGGIRPALLFTQAISAVGGTVLVHAGSPAAFVAGLVCMCLQGNPCEALRLRIIAMHTVGENRFNHRFFHRLATWAGAWSGLLLMMLLLRLLPNKNATELSTSPNCPPMDVRYSNAYLYYWQADAPTVFMSLACVALTLNFVLNALFLKVEPWYLDAQKDSMAVMPEMYLGDTMWPYALLDKEMARWSPPKEELEDIKLRAAKARAARMGPKIVPQIPKGFDLYLYTVALLAAIPIGVMSVSLFPIFATKVYTKDTTALCLLTFCMLFFTMPPVCIVIGLSFFLCCLIMDLRLSWAMTFCGGLSPSFFRGVHGEMMGSMALTLLGLWASCKEFGFPIKSNPIGNTYWEYILGDYFSFVMGYILCVLGIKRFCETARELQDKVRLACMVASEPRFSPTGGALMGSVIGMLVGAVAADKLFMTRWYVVFMPLPIFVMWLVYFPVSPIAEARLPPQVVAWINERPGKFKVPKYMWWDWFDHMAGGKWAGVKWHPNARAIIYYIALSLLFFFMYVTGMLVHLWRVCEVRYFTRLSVMQLFFGLVQVFMFAYARWPAIDAPMTDKVNSPEYLKKIGVVIACHQSRDEIVRTCRGLLKFFPPENIIACDNANSPTPLDDTKEVLLQLHPDIKYHYIPEGHKSRALWEGCHIMSHCEYIMHLDDDTQVPENFVFDPDIFADPATSGQSFGIMMFKNNRVEKWVDMEFKIISQMRYWESIAHTTWFCHGMVGMWRRDRFMNILSLHPFLPYGEDNWIGTSNLNSGWQLRQELRCNIYTYTPPVMCPACDNGRVQGYGASSIWKQRAYRWFTNQPRRLQHRVMQFIFYDVGHTVGNFIFRIQMYRHVFTIFYNMLYPIFVMHVIIYRQFIAFAILKCFMYTIGVLGYGLINYGCWAHRPDIQVEFLTVLGMPFYQGWFLQACESFGHWRGVLYYIPFWKMKRFEYTGGELPMYNGSRHPFPETVRGGGGSRAIHFLTPAPPSPRRRTTRRSGLKLVAGILERVYWRGGAEALRAGISILL